MKNTWFSHQPMSLEEANDLIGMYQSKGVPAKKCISLDNKSFMVQALLPEFRNEPIPSRQYKNPMWS